MDFEGKMTLCWVCATIMMVKVLAIVSTSQTVNDVPSNAIKPLGTMYLIRFGGTANFTHRESPSVHLLTINAVLSI